MSAFNSLKGAQAASHSRNTHQLLHSSAAAYPQSQLWPCQRLCRRTPNSFLVASDSVDRSSCCSRVEGAVSAAGSAVASGQASSSRQERCAVATAAAAQPPPPTDRDRLEQGGADSSCSGHQQQPQELPQEQRRHGEPESGSKPSSSSSTSSSSSSRGRTGSPISIDDPQLLVGDCVALVAAALYRQIAAIVLSPSFPGWFAPLSFNPLRFAEFANFAGMLVASWVVAATLTGGYSGEAVGAGVPGALRSVCKAWLVAMPICAAHLVLVTASESQALVGDNGFADVLPLAAAGPGEPLGTAAALLGLMAMWRSFYAVYLDSWVWASARDVAEDAQRFREALASVALVAAGCSLLLQVLQLSASLSGAAADGVDVGQLLLGQMRV